MRHLWVFKFEKKNHEALFCPEERACRTLRSKSKKPTVHISYLLSTWGYFSPNSVQTYGFPEIGRMCEGGRHGQDEEKEIEFHLLQYKRVCKCKNI